MEQISNACSRELQEETDIPHRTDQKWAALLPGCDALPEKHPRCGEIDIDIFFVLFGYPR